MIGRVRTNGSVSIRPATLADTTALVAGRDVEFRRFLGDGVDDPVPKFCIEIAGDVVGWVDYDTDRTWLQVGEVNVGYNVFPDHRGQGTATIAVALLFDHLADETEHTVATLLIDRRNERSIAVAERLGCERQPDFDGNVFFKLVVGD